MSRMQQAHRRAGWLCLVVLTPLIIGCVPYQTHRDEKAKLASAKAALDDMVRKYNSLHALYLQAKSGRGVAGGVSQQEHNQALAKLADLNRQLEEARKLKVEFSKEDVANVDPQAKLEDGGIVLKEGLLFNEGMSKLKSSQLAALDRLARLLATKYAGETVIVEGHTDNQPLVRTKTLYGDNWGLGYARARSVFKYLNEQGAIPKEQMVIHTYGFMKPVDPAADQNSDATRRLNRRVVIRRTGLKI